MLGNSEAAVQLFSEPANFDKATLCVEEKYGACAAGDVGLRQILGLMKEFRNCDGLDNVEKNIRAVL